MGLEPVGEVTAEPDPAFSVEAIRDLRQRLVVDGRRLDLWVVLYAHELGWETVLRPHLDLCDVVTFWTWNAAELANLEQSFVRFEQVVGDRRKVLGVYLWDYGTKQPMPLAAMEQQCGAGPTLAPAGTHRRHDLPGELHLRFGPGGGRVGEEVDRRERGSSGICGQVNGGTLFKGQSLNCDRLPAHGPTA